MNINESGFQEWVDKKCEEVVVPIDVNETSTNIGVNKSTRRAILIGCVAVDGTKLKP